jgi:Raf kinase inhibitor-like YbhB/YbcL family protein
MKELKVTLDFQSFPEKHTCSGENTSPRVGINGLDTPLFAMVLDDPDAPGGTFVHWVIWNIKNTEEIPEDVSLKDRPEELPGAVQGVNSAGSLGYTGPCPPRGSVHRYFLKVYGLDAPLSLEPGATKKMLERAVEGRARQYGEAMATFGRR